MEMLTIYTITLFTICREISIIYTGSSIPHISFVFICQLKEILLAQYFQRTFESKIQTGLEHVNTWECYTDLSTIMRSVI